MALAPEMENTNVSVPEPCSNCDCRKTLTVVPDVLLTTVLCGFTQWIAVPRHPLQVGKGPQRLPQLTRRRARPGTTLARPKVAGTQLTRPAHFFAGSLGLPPGAALSCARRDDFTASTTSA